MFNGGVASSMPGRDVSGRNTAETIIHNGYSERSEVNIGSNTESEEDLLSVSVHNHKNLEQSFKYSRTSDRNIMDSFQYRNGNGEVSSGEVVGRVRTVDVSTQSFSTPEKLVLVEPASTGVSRVHPGGVSSEAPLSTGSSWMAKFPRGSKMVTVPRGDKGFGFILVEKKVREMTPLNKAWGIP